MIKSTRKCLEFLITEARWKEGILLLIINSDQTLLSNLIFSTWNFLPLYVVTAPNISVFKKGTTLGYMLSVFFVVKYKLGYIEFVVALYSCKY